MSPIQAQKQLRELGFRMLKMRANGGTVWAFLNHTVFIPAKTQVSEGLVKRARKVSMEASISSVPVKA